MELDDLSDLVRQYILNDQGMPVRVETRGIVDRMLSWGQWMADHASELQVAEDYDEGDGEKRIRISTRFIGIDMRVLPSAGSPELWETMVFGGPLHLARDRYASKAAALAGHQAMCQRLTALLRQ